VGGTIFADHIITCCHWLATRVLIAFRTLESRATGNGCIHPMHASLCASPGVTLAVLCAAMLIFGVRAILILAEDVIGVALLGPAWWTTIAAAFVFGDTARVEICEPACLVGAPRMLSTCTLRHSIRAPVSVAPSKLDAAHISIGISALVAKAIHI